LPGFCGADFFRYFHIHVNLLLSDPSKVLKSKAVPDDAISGFILFCLSAQVEAVRGGPSHPGKIVVKLPHGYKVF
jgi:hypothetical protein